MATKLQIGDIVRVSAPDYMHHGYQGQVVGFDRSDKKEPVRVWFGREIDHIHAARLGRHTRLFTLTARYSVEPPPLGKQRNDWRTWNFPKNELVVCPAWTVKTLADRHFPNFYHTYVEPEEEIFVPFVTDCDVKGCLAVAERRILTNVWGTVFTADVCGKCAPKYHLKCGEIFEAKMRPRERVSA